MIILRQKEFARKKNKKGSTLSYSQGHAETSNDYFKLDNGGVVQDRHPNKEINDKLKFAFSNKKGKGKFINRTELGGLKAEFHYDGLRDSANRKVFITTGSDKDRSYKDFYRDLLKAERDIGKVHESNRNKSDLSKSRKKLLNGEFIDVTNKDIKDEIRKLAKKEKLERVAKKTAIIGVPVAAAAIGTGVAIKKHHDKKKKEQEQE